MARHRTHSMEFKRFVVEEYLAGEPLHGLGRRHIPHQNPDQPKPQIPNPAQPEIRSRHRRDLPQPIHSLGDTGVRERQLSDWGKAESV